VFVYLIIRDGPSPPGDPFRLVDPGVLFWNYELEVVAAVVETVMVYVVHLVVRISAENLAVHEDGDSGAAVCGLAYCIISGFALSRGPVIFRYGCVVLGIHDCELAFTQGNQAVED